MNITQGVAASQRRKGLLEFLRKIKEEKVPGIDEKITKKKTENERTCESQIKKVKKHFDDVISKLTDIRKRKEEELKSNLLSETDACTPDSDSRYLVKHLTLTGDVIQEYEYQEDGETRLFIAPIRLCQNNNTDTCVVNMTSDDTGEIVIVSLSGHLRSGYRGQNLKENFFPFDLVCDSTCNVLVIDPANSLIHLLSPEGEFLKFLLTEKEVTEPVALSQHKSTLWVETGEGIWFDIIHTEELMPTEAKTQHVQLLPYSNIAAFSSNRNTATGSGSNTVDFHKMLHST
ncbi:uncharacterized protein LOC134258926 [Saccostrea cucullata]|uniref:uncharacterized protein LOC134258926 n=1 Tax=Saccostrea cuccullata TaxID=36930 RepID=UPI002ED69EE3